jgi:signal peptidase I
MIPTLLIGDYIISSKISYSVELLMFNRIVKLNQIRKGDLVVFENAKWTSLFIQEKWIKRVIAKRNDVINIYKNKVYINNVISKQHFHRNQTYKNYCTLDKVNKWFYFRSPIIYENFNNKKYLTTTFPKLRTLKFYSYWPTNTISINIGLKCNDGKCYVKKGFVFVLGDNRGGSSDSRVFGGVFIKKIKGRAIFVIFNTDCLNRFTKYLHKKILEPRKKIRYLK